MSNGSFASVWDAIEDTPAEAENMKLRSALMMALEQHIKRPVDLGGKLQFWAQP